MSTKKSRRNHAESCKQVFKRSKHKWGRPVSLESKHTTVRHIGIFVQEKFILVKIFPSSSAKTKESWSYWLQKFWFCEIDLGGGLF